ncbi:MAG: DUF3352 domain-containing protein [Phormidesmis sp.]
MTAAAPPPDQSRPDNNNPDKNRPERSFFSGRFFGGLLALALTLIAAGVSIFWMLSANSPLALLQGGDRPIAAATAFVPAHSPFTLSLLTRPDNLVALQRSLLQEKSSQLDPQLGDKPNNRPSNKTAKPLNPQQRASREVDQLKQSLLKNTGLDYERDIQPWIGNEVTFAFTDADLDRDEANGQQAGYLVAVEIAAEQQQQAREFLQLFWQRQALLGKSPRSEQTSGVRILSGDMATALVGNHLVIFANDVRVLRRSIRAAQSVTNLAQNRAYRQSVAQLREDRVGLAYFDTSILNEPSTAQSFMAIGLGLTRAGIGADIRLAEAAPVGFLRDRTKAQPTASTKAGSSVGSEPKLIDLLKFFPESTPLALISQNLAQLKPTLITSGLPSDILPDFLQLGTQSGEQISSNDQADEAAWDWIKPDYALGKISAGKEGSWILAIAPEPSQRAEGIAQLDALAQAKGYSAVPVMIGDDQAIAWTRLQTKGRSRANGLETEILGLRLQQGEYEILASSFTAMEAALAAENRSLLSASQFTEAIAALPVSSFSDESGYLYANWSAVEPALSQFFPILKQIKSVAPSLVSHIDTLAATREGQSASAFIRLAP